eukprot:CAMPEP_0181119864 /NCGR_PEP_ID=MMETSP1071-20121207/23827_1 /TAXON_ID=35127 /ORGANISM="Thalassiosira sp., Strain NH16" /LENGTH=89 /DNA_ID=CAMNT_0023204435 /DNA_START=180 /DNA_END=447 /DNA_ORIENTATION=-
MRLLETPLKTLASNAWRVESDASSLQTTLLSSVQRIKVDEDDATKHADATSRLEGKIAELEMGAKDKNEVEFQKADNNTLQDERTAGLV